MGSGGSKAPMAAGMQRQPGSRGATRTETGQQAESLQTMEEAAGRAEESALSERHQRVGRHRSPMDEDDLGLSKDDDLGGHHRPLAANSAEYESRWSDDGDVLTMVVAEKSNKDDDDDDVRLPTPTSKFEDSDSSLDDDIKEIERTVSVDSGLATSFMGVSMLAPMKLLSDDVESLVPRQLGVAPVLSKEATALFSKRFQEAVDVRSDGQAASAVRPCTSYGNPNASQFRLQQKQAPRRRSIAPLLAIERVKSVDLKANAHEEKEEDEWEYKQPEIEGFDLAKFKQANSSFSSDPIQSISKLDFDEGTLVSDHYTVDQPSYVMEYHRPTWLTVSCSRLWTIGVDGHQRRFATPDDCLHRYLEKDFGNLDLSANIDSRHPAEREYLDMAAKDKECSSWQTTLDCYDNVHRVRDKRLYRRLVTGLHEMNTWICDSDIEQYKDFIGGVKCLRRLTDGNMCAQHRHTKNKWQKLLRLEFGTEVCQQFVSEHRCLLDKMPYYCQRRAVQGYNHSMNIVLNNWCHASKGAVSTATSLALLVASAATAIFSRSYL